MKNIARFTAAVAALAMAASLQPASAKPVTRTDTYIGSFDPLTYGICKAEGAPENIGKVCFKIPKKKRTAEMSLVDPVADTLGPRAGFFFMFIDPQGNCVGDDPDDPASVCPNADSGCTPKKWPIPRKAKSLEIYPNTFLGLTCVLDGDTGFAPATAGTVTVRFS